MNVGAAAGAGAAVCPKGAVTAVVAPVEDPPKGDGAEEPPPKAKMPPEVEPVPL